MLELKVVSEMPLTKRSGGGRRSEEREQIIEALRSGNISVVENVESQKAFNALQQRIRTAGEKIGVKVTIRFHKHDGEESGDVYFAPKDQADA